MKRSNVIAAGVIVTLSLLAGEFAVTDAADFQLHIGSATSLFNKGLTTLSEMASSTKGLVGQWSGSYFCSGWHPFTLTITGSATDLDAVMRFYWQGRANGATGSYELHGTYDEVTRTITLEPLRWLVQARGFYMVGLQGVVSGTGINGRVHSAGCRSFQLVRQTTEPVSVKPTSKIAITPSNEAGSQNLVQNGNFEIFTGAFRRDGGAQLLRTSTTLTGWRIVGGEIAVLKTPNIYNLSAQDGRNFLDLTGYSNWGFPKGVSQTLTGLKVGQTYDLSLELGVRNGACAGGDNCVGPVSASVSVGDASQTFTYNSSVAGNDWGAFTMNFVASAPSEVLTINGISVPRGGEFLGLDNVSVVSVKPGSKATVTQSAAPAAATSGRAEVVHLSHAPDIVGLRLGMSLKAAVSAIKQQNPHMRITERNRVIDNVAATKYVERLAASDGRVAPGVGPRDAIGMEFAPPPGRRETVFVERFLGFPANGEPLEAATEQALRAKYGTPSYVRRIGPDVYMYWAYNPDGLQIFGRTKSQPCGDVAALDPTSDVGSLVFANRKTPGCGVTVAAMMERNQVGNTAPAQWGDQIIFLFVYLIDDSHLKALRVSANNYALKLLHKAGSKVAVPTL